METRGRDGGEGMCGEGMCGEDVWPMYPLNVELPWVGIFRGGISWGEGNLTAR